MLTVCLLLFFFIPANPFGGRRGKVQELSVVSTE